MCRLLSHPPVKASPSLNHPVTLPTPTTDDTHESHSAPSSPTRNQPPVITARNDILRSASPSARPRSVMVNSDLNYTELQFPGGSNNQHPAPRPRVKTNYSNVIPQAKPTNDIVDVTGEVDSAPEPPPRDTHDNLGQDSREQIDPFADFDVSDDPQAFYDRPGPTRLAPASTPAASSWTKEQPETQNEVEVDTEAVVSDEILDDGEPSDGGIDDDCTGGSAYMDTTQFLRTTKEQTNFGDPFFTSDDPQPPFDERDDITPTAGDDNVLGELGPYDFPLALANFPTGGSGGSTNAVEKPAKRDVVDESHDIKSTHNAG